MDSLTHLQVSFRHFLLVFVLVIGGTDEVSAQSSDRLAGLGRLDGAIHYFHPVVATRATPWDAAFARHAIAAVHASTRPQYLGAIDSMLAGIGDAATYRVNQAQLSWQGRWLADSTLLIAPSPAPADAALAAQTSVARKVILDLRGVVGGVPEHLLARTLLTGTASAPAMRALRYAGLQESVFPRAGDVYRTTWQMIPGEEFAGSAKRDVPIAVVADARTVLPGLVLVLRSLGRAPVVGIGTQRIAVGGSSVHVTLYDDVRVAVRLGERVGYTNGLRADTSVADARIALALASEIADRGVAGIATSDLIDTLGRVRAAPSPNDEEWRRGFPSAGYRLLAAARIWNTVHYFFPHKGIMGSSWDDDFRRLAGNIESATNALAYADAIRAVLWGLHDSHVVVGNTAVARREFYEHAPLPLTGRFVQDSLMITRSDRNATDAGVLVGDVITHVAGVPVATLLRQLSNEIVWSTPQGLRRELPRRILSTRDGRYSVLTVRGADGRSRTIRLQPIHAPAKKEREGEIVHILPDNIGYVDLDRLMPADVDRMFDTLADVRAIIFDMRGYPNGTGWAIAARLSKGNEPVAATYHLLDIRSPDSVGSRVVVREQRVPRNRGRRYDGPTVMLMDERTMSQAEHTGLLLGAANGTVFVGGATVGANGNVTNVILPGNVQVWFTGMDVRHPDGRPTQRIGLVPVVPVSPTVRGLREGRDEVLDAALTFLRTR